MKGTKNIYVKFFLHWNYVNFQKNVYYKDPQLDVGLLKSPPKKKQHCSSSQHFEDCFTQKYPLMTAHRVHPEAQPLTERLSSNRIQT